MAIVHQCLQLLPACLRLAPLFTFCGRALGGSWVKKCENTSVTKLTHSAIK